jgi:hypothetical protein
LYNTKKTTGSILFACEVNFVKGTKNDSKGETECSTIFVQ